MMNQFFFFFSSRRRHTRLTCDWSSDVCSSDLPASDLAEGLLNNVDRPPVTARGNGRVLYEGRALPHFNEVDECAGLDALVTNRIWTSLGLDPETTLHDVRYGEAYQGEFVWVFEISGA